MTCNPLSVCIGEKYQEEEREEHEQQGKEDEEGRGTDGEDAASVG